jgi:hypothetical protein
MSRFRFPLAILVGAVLLSAGPLLAGPLRKEQVSAKAKWLIHADVKAFLASKTGTFVLEDLKKKGLETVLNNIQEAFAFDLTKDLKGLTVYGSGFGKNPAIIVAHATMDRDRLTQVVQGNYTYRELKYAGHTVHQWTDNPDSDQPGPTRFGVFHGEGLLVLTQDLHLIEHAVDVLDKKTASLASRGTSAALPSAAKAPFLTACLMELPQLGKGKAEGVALGKVASASLEAEETGERLRVHLTVTAKTAKAAASLRKVADGILGFFDLASPEKAGGASAAAASQVVLGDTVIPAEVIAVLKNVAVTARGRTVKVDADLPVADVTGLLRILMDQGQKSGETSAEK